MCGHARATLAADRRLGGSWSPPGATQARERALEVFWHVRGRNRLSVFMCHLIQAVEGIIGDWLLWKGYVVTVAAISGWQCEAGAALWGSREGMGLREICIQSFRRAAAYVQAAFCLGAALMFER